MKDFKNAFKNFGGDYIPDIIEYLKDYIEKDPYVTITVGCDSIQRRRKTIYAITIMLYNTDIRKGAHVVFFRENHTKIRDTQERLYKEAQYVYDIGTYLDDELSSFYIRKDLSDFEKKKYKYHLLNCDGKYLTLDPIIEETFIKKLILDSKDVECKLVDLHVDFNPSEGAIEKGGPKNKSYIAYKTYVPWLRGVGFRTWAKNSSPAASTAADLLLKYKKNVNTYI